MQMLRELGYWTSGLDDGLPDPARFVDPAMEPEERSWVADYLDRGLTIAVAMGGSRCRICGAGVGSGEYSDGEFVWPEGLSHYVREHSVRLPAAFFDHIEDLVGRLELIPRDSRWWIDHTTGS